MKGAGIAQSVQRLATNWTIRESNPGVEEIFRTRPASNTMGTGSFPGVKRPGLGVYHPPRIAPRLRKEQSYTSTTPLGLRGLFQGEIYFYLYPITSTTSPHSYLQQTGSYTNILYRTVDQACSQSCEYRLLASSCPCVRLSFHIQVGSQSMDFHET